MKSKEERGKRMRLREARDAFLLILPFFVLVSIFSIYPVYQGINLCFYKVMLPEDKYIGLRNFERLRTDNVLTLTLQNTVYYGLFQMLGIVLAILPALLVNSIIMQARPRLRWLFQAAVLLPMVIGWVTLGMAWNWMFLIGAGALAAGRPGAVTVSPLARIETALPTVGLILIWAILGYNTILFLAGLRSIPKVMYEAAQIDGATNWQAFRYVTLPAMKPMLTFMIVTGFIGAFQVFDPVATLTNGGPGWYSASIVFYMVRQAWYALDYGYAAAIGLVVLTIVFTLSLIQFRIIYKRYV
ncbi:MAG: sugar ABC transporter permease [Candidatus Bathyarchaeia archaeon]